MVDFTAAAVTWVRSPRTHLVLTIIWVALLWPTVGIWKDSVTWVAVMSWWAIVITHLTTYIAARAEVAAETVAEEEGKGDGEGPRHS